MVMQIKRLRERKGLKQIELAAALGVAQNAVSNWETEVTLPRARQIPGIADALGCTIGELFAAPGGSSDLDEQTKA